jgi:hypothetical protein
MDALCTVRRERDVLVLIGEAGIVACGVNSKSVDVAASWAAVKAERKDADAAQ